MKPIIPLAGTLLVLVGAIILWRASATPEVASPAVNRTEPENSSSGPNRASSDSSGTVDREESIVRSSEDVPVDPAARRVRFVSEENPIVMPDQWELSVGDTVSTLGQVTEYSLPPHTAAGMPVQASWRGRVVGSNEVSRSGMTDLEVSPCALVEFVMADPEPCTLLWASDASAPRYDIKPNEVASEDGEISGFLPVATELRIAVHWDKGVTRALGLLTLSPWQVHRRIVERPPYLTSVSGIVTDSSGQPMPAFPVQVVRPYPWLKTGEDYMILPASSARLFGGFKLDTVTDDAGHFVVQHSDVSTRFLVIVWERSDSYTAASIPWNGSSWCDRGEAFVSLVVRPVR